MKIHNSSLVRDRIDIHTEAAAAGLSKGKSRRRQIEILQARVDIFRLEFGLNPPVRIVPMQVRLKADARSIKV